jgi:hypothetical protein
MAGARPPGTDRRWQSRLGRQPASGTGGRTPLAHRCRAEFARRTIAGLPGTAAVRPPDLGCGRAARARRARGRPVGPRPRPTLGPRRRDRCDATPVPGLRRAPWRTARSLPSRSGASSDPHPEPAAGGRSGQARAIRVAPGRSRCGFGLNPVDPRAKPYPGCLGRAVVRDSAGRSRCRRARAFQGRRCTRPGLGRRALGRRRRSIGRPGGPHRPAAILVSLAGRGGRRPASRRDAGSQRPGGDTGLDGQPQA